MSFADYAEQLQNVNEALQSCSEAEKEELLSLKCSIEELLALTSDDQIEEHTETNNDIDEEYAQFMNEINNDATTTEESYSSIQRSEYGTDTDKLKLMEGKRCRAPHVNKWGSKQYHNAMICSVLESSDASDEIQAKVLFTNPTHEEMLPCPYYFDNDCKFSEEKCKFSHGEIVSISELQDYIEPNFESLKIGSEILAKQKNNLWARARIMKILDKTCMVKFESTKNSVELCFESILPLEGNTEGNEGDENSDYSSDSDVCTEQDVINLSLMNTPSNGPLGNWEQYTKGIGSKLMRKMGYIIGTGLGKESNGRIEPVTAVILPAGKSLDHCMNLREKTGGDRDLFSAERRIKRRQKKLEKRNIEPQEKKKDVFEFINDTLCTRTETATFNKSQNRRSMKGESSRDLNVANLKTDEDIKRTERNVQIIKESLTRHKDVNSQVHKCLKNKLQETLGELQNLKTQAQNIKNEQNFRKDKRKMTIF